MMKALWCGLLAACVLGGCQREPSYRVADIRFDEGLVGEWRFAGASDPEATYTVRFTERPLRSDGERVSPEPGLLPRRNVRGSRGYSIAFSGEGETHEMIGFLIDCQPDSVLGVQTDPAQLDRIAPPGWVLPVHHVFRLRRDGDRLTLRSPRREIAWVPLYVNSEPAVKLPTDASAGYTASADELVAAVRTLTDDDWEEPMVGARVAD